MRVGRRRKSFFDSFVFRIFAVFIFFGLLICFRPWIYFLNSLPPLYAFLALYSMIFTGTALILGGVEYGSGKIGLREIFGATFIMLAFIIVFGGISSPWAYTAEGKELDVPSALIAEPDGVIYYHSYNFFKQTGGISLLGWNFTDYALLAALTTYLLTPFILLSLSYLLLKRRGFRKTIRGAVRAV